MMAIIPYALAFTTNTMIFVVTKELIPESQANSNTDMATLRLIVSFIIILVINMALG
jgi:ZIP family zinc transporter